MRVLWMFTWLIFLSACDHPERESFDRHKDHTRSSSTEEQEIAYSEESLESSDIPVDETFVSDLPKASIRNVLKMENQNGVKYVWIEVNEIKLKFIFDTGASSICISTAEAIVLFRQGTLQKEDILSTQYFQDATGKISEGTKVNLKTVKIGDLLLKNIEATVIDNVDAPLLLGQTVLERFGKIEIDNENGEIILSE